MPATDVLDVLPGEVRVYSAPVAGRDGHKFSSNDDGSKTVFGLEIFKAGTFRDSLGDQTTWTEAHLDQMVFHFGLLRDNDTLANVPFRADHSFSVERVVGYIENLYRTGDKLSADVTITEPPAFDKFQRGTYRARSLEVGMYGTNGDEFYYPVVLGCAFVDIPAVEGLHRNGHPVKSYSLAPPATPKEPHVPDTPAPVPFAFRLGDTTESDYAKVQAHIDQLTTKVTDLTTQVTSHEDFKKGVRDGERTAFVTGLAAANKIAQPQVAGLTAVAISMDDAQFESFKTSYELAPVLPLLGKHSGSPDSPTPSDNEGTADRREVLEEMLAVHRRAGLSEGDIAKTASYRELQTLVGAK